MVALEVNSKSSYLIPYSYILNEVCLAVTFLMFLISNQHSDQILCSVYVCGVL